MQSLAPIFWALVLVPCIIYFKDNTLIYVILAVIFVLLIVYHSISPEEWEKMRPVDDSVTDDPMDDYVSILDVYKANIEEEERNSQLTQSKEKDNE